MIHVIRYSVDKKKEWDDFVRTSKNGIFMFLRDYMDYHSHRYADHSLLLIKENKLIALLPANEILDQQKIISHEGLTFGGFITSCSMKTAIMLECFGVVINYYKNKGYKHFIYKQLPHIYSEIPSEEDAYALFRYGAQLLKVEPTTTILLEKPAKANPRSNKAAHAGVTIDVSENYAGYWNLLSTVLQEKYGVKPVHSLDEILMLHNIFPEQIKLYTASKDRTLLAGVIVYLNNAIIHTQYIATNSLGKELGALNLLLHSLIKQYTSTMKYLDFGISTENNGKILNEGLITQKERQGGRCITHYTWAIEL